nr:immunoglobulin heavy chain junction region [Macaca mulatta]MOV55184.1 immunoglobulin heavy chain junction region [Macaca mulatta]MOV55593.1 immunoglobulin heavy chain junction region [Macaca mulatta]MOV55741.1 immunoglobulin heavy chain junction region [Macaca mulatta]MOV56463.1 immunoglobulin heavy chain junction region [Macaca mulatta]
CATGDDHGSYYTLFDYC